MYINFQISKELTIILYHLVLIINFETLYFKNTKNVTNINSGILSKIINIIINLY